MFNIDEKVTSGPPSVRLMSWRPKAAAHQSARTLVFQNEISLNVLELAHWRDEEARIETSMTFLFYLIIYIIIKRGFI